MADGFWTGMLIVWLWFAALNAACGVIRICLNEVDDSHRHESEKVYGGQEGARRLLKQIAQVPVMALAGPLLWVWLAERSFSRLLRRAYPDGFGFWKRTERHRKQKRPTLREQGQDLMAEMQEYEEQKRQQERQSAPLPPSAQKTVDEAMKRSGEKLQALATKLRGRYPG